MRREGFTSKEGVRGKGRGSRARSGRVEKEWSYRRRADSGKEGRERGRWEGEGGRSKREGKMGRAGVQEEERKEVVGSGGGEEEKKGRGGKEREEKKGERGEGGRAVHAENSLRASSADCLRASAASRMPRMTAAAALMQAGTGQVARPRKTNTSGASPSTRL